MSGGGAIAVGIIVMLLALYLGLAPLAANESGSIELGDPMPYALPTWYYFPGGVQISVSWSEADTFTYVGVRTCDNANCSFTASSVVANGTGPGGTETFTALPGASYEVFTDQGASITVQTDYSVTYEIVVLILVIASIAAIGYGYFVMRSHSDLRRF